ncbi:hypothetical protein N431DRAFT_456123 [Stipitochalara longipes BDJ]|nr:hypothetical protein N431DRAFT_456123 [Stipitochalara longipes BDJ]
MARSQGGRDATSLNSARHYPLLFRSSTLPLQLSATSASSSTEITVSRPALVIKLIKSAVGRMGAEISAQLKEAGIEASIEYNPQHNTGKHEGNPDLQRTAGIPCVVCGEDALWLRDTCSQCKDAKYCSEQRKVTDARFHKLLCSSLKYFAEPPNNTYRRAIVFDHDADEPRFVWIPVAKLNGLESPEQYLATLVEGEVSSIPIDTNAVRGRILQNRITVYFSRDETAIKLGNESVASVVEAAMTRDGMTEKSVDAWYGTYVFMAHNGFNNYSFRDMTFADFRHVIDFLSVHNRVSTSPSTWASRAKKIEAVRVHAFEEESLQFEQLYYPQDHPNVLERFDNPIKKEKDVNAYDIPDALRLPLCWTEGQRDAHVEICGDHKDLTKEVDFVRRCLIPEMESRFNSCGPHRQMDYTFIREDLVDLKKEHMMAITDFCVDKIMGLQDNNTYQTEKAKNYRAVATKKAFERYWKKCKRNYGWDKKLPSPYEADIQDEMEE